MYGRVDGKKARIERQSLTRLRFDFRERTACRFSSPARAVHGVVITMKKYILILTAFFLVLSAGCAKQTAGDPAAAQNSTLKAVPEDQAEVTLALKLEASTTAAAEQVEAGTVKEGESRTAPSNTESAAAKETTRSAAKDEETTAKTSDAANGAGSTTTDSVEPQQTTSAGGITVGSAAKASSASSQGETLPKADSGKDRYELPAIPLN